MELIVSAVAGDVVNRFISFVINRYQSKENLAEKIEKLQELLIRVHMIVEEADVRYITNSKMLLKLKKLAEVMYQGYHVMDTIKCRNLCSTRTENEVSRFQDLSFHTSLNRLRTMKCTPISYDIHSTLDNLESIASNMKEFVLLLSGCERMFRTPFDSYLYTDNFMFGRHVEKQQVINILLQDNLPPFAPTVLPIIGGCRVGKKTLVAHVCNNEKVRSKFSSILHMNGESIWRIEHEPAIIGRSLVIIEFTSDVHDEHWLKFYSSATKMEEGSKILIVSRIPKLSRFGTVKPVLLNNLSLEEYRYLFKVLAFGSTNPEENTQLASIANDIAVALSGSLVTANVYADMLRRNQNVRFWQSMLNKYRNVVENNFSVFGEHPKKLMDKDHPIDITRLALSSSSFPAFATLRLMPPHSEIDDSRRELPKVMFGDMIAGTALLPKQDFELVAWESRIPPYKKFVNFATYCDQDKTSQNGTESPSNKRQRSHE